MKNVLIFSATAYGKRVWYSLDDTVYRLNAFIDNNEEIQHHSVFGIPVIAPKEIKEYDYDFIIIAIAAYEKEIKAQLLGIGVPEYKIITFLPDACGIVWKENRHIMLRSCIDEIKNNEVSGNMAELGVYKGDFAQYLNRYLPNKKLYLFDTFEGFNGRDKSKNDYIHPSSSNFKDTTVDMVMAKMVKPENVIIKKGYFPDTAVGLEEKYCLVSLDADLYLSILNGLEYFYPRLERGGYIFIHDFDNIYWPGVKKAVTECCMRNSISYVPILDRCGSVIMAK